MSLQGISPYVVMLALVWLGILLCATGGQSATNLGRRSGLKDSAAANAPEEERRLLLNLDESAYVGEQHKIGRSRQSPPSKYERRSRARHDATKRPTVPTAPPRPDKEVRHRVQWFEYERYYASKASNDDSLRIRQAPLPASGTPWPMPQVYQPSELAFRIDPELFRILAVGESCDVLEYAFGRALKNTFLDYEPADVGGARSSSRFLAEKLFGAGAGGGGGGTGGNGSLSPVPTIAVFNVTVLRQCNDGAMPHLEMDESYDLEVKHAGVSLVAREVWGALKGLETFSQLVYQDYNDVYMINSTYIHDFPRFPHRGVLLDTARHYISKDTLITNLELMAQNKLNVFHWHIVDDNSFPFQSKVYPELSEKGAYDPVTHIYSYEDIEEVIEEARLRGIRVIPEFDTPGHTFSWGLGQDNLLTPCYDYAKQPDGYYGPVNPILKSTYRFLEGLFQEVLTVFKDKYVHLGGDEVPFNCWYSNPFLNSFIKRNNLTDIKALLNLYEKKLLDIITKIGTKREQGAGYIVWQEVFNNGIKLKPDTIVEIWTGDAFDIGRVTGAGFRTLFSTCWYLNYINYGQDWDKFYLCENIGQLLEDYRVQNQSLILGGEICLWAEFADDGIILPTLWPRASAAAERLWSNRHLVNAEAAAPRIEEQRCRMIRQGFQVGVLSGPGYCRRSKKLALKQKVKRDWRMSDGIQGYKIQNKEVKLANVYVLDVKAMYVVPFLIIICLCCVLLLSSFYQTEQKSCYITIWNLSPASLRIRPRSLIFAFITFVVIWCLWSSPMWLHLWETGRNSSS